MQTAQATQQFTNSNNSRPHLSGYDLTTLLIRGGLAKLGLNANAKQVLLYLATCYNEKNGVVFPRVRTIAEAMGISEIGVKRAIAELVTKGCILKSKRRKNANEYIITAKVMYCNDTTSVHNDTSKKYHSDTSHEHEVKSTESHEVEEQQLKKADVVSLSNFSLKRVPASILAKKTDKNGKPIRSHVAYWNSFTDEQKREYLKFEEAEEQKLKKRAELKKQQEAEEQKKCAEEEAERKAFEALPIEERHPKAQTIRSIWNLRNFIKQGKKPLSYLNEAIEHYNLDYSKIARMTAEEVEAYIAK